MADLSVELCGVKLKNPVLAASGTFGFGREYNEFYDVGRIGGIVGRVVTIKEDEIVIETGADRTKMRIQRWAVNTNKTKMEQHRKEVEAAKEAAKKKKEEKAAAKGKGLKAKSDEKADNKADKEDKKEDK